MLILSIKLYLQGSYVLFHVAHDVTLFVHIVKIQAVVVYKKMCSLRSQSQCVNPRLGHRTAGCSIDRL